MAAIGGFLYYWLKMRGRMVLHHPFDAMVFLKQLQDEKCVYTIAPPAALNKLLAQKDQILTAFDLSNLKTIGSGSAPLDPDMITGFTDTFDVEILNIFGSNEGMALIGNQVDIPDPAERARFFPRFGRQEHNWANKVSARTQTRLVDTDSGSEITEPGREGELQITGVTVFDGYYNSPDDNAVAFSADGYFKSGDLFEIAGDKNQYYRFVGRCKDLIIRGGVNISPEELDEVISSHPDILEAAVYGYADKIMGEKVCAVIAPVDGKQLSLSDITAHLEKLDVAKFKWPEKIKTVDALPRNPMNKVVRRALGDI
jgi:acyl-CoA synthetase (AMP-forming)/AMP-acid ligase II